MLPGAFRRLWMAAIALAFVGAVGLALLVFMVYPVLWARWAFFLCLSALATGVSLPLIAYLHHRFPAGAPTHERTVLREGVWVGLYLGVLAWLQLGRILTPISALIPAVGLAALEAFLLVGEKHRKM